MLSATGHERQAIVDYLASQAPDDRVDLIQKVYTEQLHGTTHDIWDVHTDKDRWWVITEPDKLYERPVCTACGWAGEPVEVSVTASASGRTQPDGDCVIMTVPLRGARPPRPTGNDE